MTQKTLEELSREELIELVLKMQEENLRLKQKVSELEEKLAPLPLKGGFRPPSFCTPLILYIKK